MTHLSIPLVALYLRGAPRPVEVRRSSWMDVLRVLRRSACDASSAPGALRNAGHWAEALVLESPGLLSWAESMVEGGRVLAISDPGYPCRWQRVLGPAAPPVLWRAGEIPSLPSIGIVGSRTISAPVARFCAAVAGEAVRLGFSVVSGRAEGCDRAAAGGAVRAGGDVIEILPHGIDLARPSVGCLLSACQPSEPFSAANAMERNALIYAAASHTCVGHARFKEGGTWHGALHASRSRLTTLILRRSPEQGMRALASLGGVWLDSPADLSVAIKSSGPQAELFGGIA